MFSREETLYLEAVNKVYGVSIYVAYLLRIIRFESVVCHFSIPSLDQHKVRKASSMPTLLSLLSPLALSLVLPVIVATVPSASASAACSAISATGIPTLGEVTDALNPQFIDAQSHYWSAANADLHPACAVFPTTAEEVSQIVTILQNSTGVNFAVKSGGHNPNVGYSSTDGGILISMSNISSTIISSDQKTADIGPGARWVQVAEALEPYGVNVVGGRLGKYLHFPEFLQVRLMHDA
jgi:hypothetical protein